MLRLSSVSLFLFCKCCLYIVHFATVWIFLFPVFVLFSPTASLREFSKSIHSSTLWSSLRVHADQRRLEHELNPGEVTAASVHYLSIALGWTFRLFPAAV